MNDAKKEKLKETLVASGLMEQEDTIIELLQTSYVEKGLLGKGVWKQGWGYFTEKRFICPVGVLGGGFVIPYQNIKELGKCSQSLLPIGITITYTDPKTDKVLTSQFSMMKRDQWLKFLAEKSGVAQP